MQLTNLSKLQRDAQSLFKAGWNSEKIILHFARNPEDYGTGLTSDGLRKILNPFFDGINAAIRAENRETARLIRETVERHLLPYASKAEIAAWTR